MIYCEKNNYYCITEFQDNEKICIIFNYFIQINLVENGSLANQYVKILQIIIM